METSRDSVTGRWRRASAGTPEPIAEPLPDVIPVEPLVSLRYLTSELRRRRHVWIATGLIGLLIGAGFHQVVPRTFQASTLLIMAHNPGSDPLLAMETDVDLAAAHPVAARAAASLGPGANASSLVKSYHAVSLTPDLLKLTASGPSYSDAVNRANAIAEAFLGYRGDELKQQNQQVLNALSIQMKSVQNEIQQLTTQINSGTAGQASSDLTNAVALQSQEEAQLTQLQATSQSDTVTTNSIVGGSTILDPARAILASSAKLTIINGLTGLIGGLGLGLLLVVIPCLISDRLRSRYDVARALDAPVNLSVRHGRRLSRGKGRATSQVADFLYQQVVGSATVPTYLAVVAVDNAKTCATVLDVVAKRLASEGFRVLVADLTLDALLARRYGSGSDGGLVVVSSHQARGGKGPEATGEPPQVAGSVLLGHPAGSTVSTGPFDRADRRAGCDPLWHDAANEADFVLTLAELDPAHGADHLAGWAPDAIAVVTAGKSSGVRIQAVGNMIRHAGVRLRCAVLLDADPTDDTSGLVHPVPPPVSPDRLAGTASR